MDRKTFPVREVKADDDPPGTFEAVVSVFGNVDRVGDVVVPGAFKASLERDPHPPIGWMHDDSIPPIGIATEAVETPEGLRIKARLFLDDHPIARQVHAGLMSGAIKQFSFGYHVTDQAFSERDGKRVRLLKELELFEASPVWVGANPATRLVGAKRGGRVVQLTARRADLLIP